MACRGGQADLFDNHAGFFGMLFEVGVERLAHGFVDHAGYLVVAELGLGLALELRLGHLDGDDGCQALAEVVAVELYLGLLELVEELVVLGIFLERARQGRAEAGEVRSTLYRVDIVDVRVDVFGIRSVVDHRHFDRRAEFVGRQMDDVGNEFLARLVDVEDEFLQSVLRVEDVGAVFALFVFLAPVGERQADAGVQIGQFAEAAGKYVVAIDGRCEDAAVGPEGDGGAGRFGRAHLADAVGRLAAGVLLGIAPAVAPHLHTELGRQRVDARNAHAVEAARHLVGVFVELAAGVQHGHHHFESRAAFLLVHVYRDTSAVVGDGYGVIFVDRYLDVVAISGKRLVD